MSNKDQNNRNFNIMCQSHKQGLTVDITKDSCESSEFEMRLYQNVTRLLNKKPEKCRRTEIKKVLNTALHNMNICWNYCENTNLELDVNARRRN